MTVQRIGEKLLRRCRALAQQPYSSGWTRGGWPHGEFECQYPGPEGGPMNSDRVNLKTRHVRPLYRDGQRVGSADKT